MKNDTIKNTINQYMMCTFGALLFAGGINILVAPLGLYNGGFVGLGQLFTTILARFFHIEVTAIDLSGIIYFILNIPLFILAFTSMSKPFFCKSIYTVILQTILLAFIKAPSTLIIQDMLTACIIGGLVTGLGAGIILRAASSGGGQDILGVYFSKKLPSFSVGKVSIIINSFIFGACAFLFNLEVVIYSLIYTVIYSLVVDKVHVQNIKSTAIIITKNTKLCALLIKEMNRGVTKINGFGGFTNKECDILLIVLSKYELNHLIHIVKENDHHAFCIVSDDSQIYGNFEKRLDV